MHPQAQAKKPEVSSLLSSAANIVGEALGRLDTGVALPCESCGLKKSNNWIEHKAGLELSAILKKLYRWAETFDKGY